jgi:hypothetical protein
MLSLDANLSLEKRLSLYGEFDLPSLDSPGLKGILPLNFLGFLPKPTSVSTLMISSLQMSLEIATLR